MQIKFFKFDSLDSTMDKAKQLLPDNGSLVVSSRSQSKGRGRNGYNWWSERDKGLYFTYARPTDLQVNKLKGLSIAVGVILASHFKHIGLKVGLKWPNDLYANGLKLGGVLIETKLISSTITEVYIGVGINLKPVEQVNSISLGELGDFKLELDCLVGDLSKGIEQFLSGSFKDLSQRYQEFDILYQKNISYFYKGQKVKETARCLGINEDGMLLIDSQFNKLDAQRVEKVRLIDG